MKRFEPFTLDRAALDKELDSFRRLLGPPQRELSERKKILPFFKSRLNLASLLGFYNSHLVAPDVIKPELEIFGDHSCDLAVGERQGGKCEFCFVEFEDARRNSIFQRGGKGTPDWANRLEHGFSQIVDWFHTLSGQTQTPQFREFFGTDLANYCGLLVIGRDAFLTDPERDRLRWRSQHVFVAGKPVSIITFDQLLRDLTSRVNFSAPRKPTGRKVLDGTTVKRKKGTS